MRFLTINACITDNLNDKQFKKQERKLKDIVYRLRNTYTFIDQKTNKPIDRQIKMWCSREVEPIISNNNTEWKWHWHILTYMCGISDAELADELRKAWSEPYAIRLEPIRGKTDKHYLANIKNIICYSGKIRLTYLDSLQSQRQYLNNDDLQLYANWLVNMSNRWRRFTI